jgi:hypothetical protein
MWCSPDARSCHKCGDPTHLVIKCLFLQKSVTPNDNEKPIKPKILTQNNSMQRLYNKYKPAGFRKFVDSNRSNCSSKSYSKAIKNKNTPTPPPLKDVIILIVKDSVYNLNNEINNKLDQILSILSNMKKDMNELDARITKLESL